MSASRKREERSSGRLLWIVKKVVLQETPDLLLLILLLCWLHVECNLYLNTESAPTPLNLVAFVRDL